MQTTSRVILSRATSLYRNRLPFQTSIRRQFAADAKAPSADSAIKKDGKIDINIVEDVFRSNRLAGLGDRYHQLNRAFDIVRSGRNITPELEKDLKAVFDVTSLKTADSAEVRKAKTKALVEHYQRRPGDTGSAEVQCVLFTERINYLSFHMTRFPQDRKLKLDYNKVIVRRRKLLKYLKHNRFRTYQIICRDLGIKEEEMEIVGRLSHKRPYYDPSRPVYRRPLSDAEIKEQEELLAAEKAKEQIAIAKKARDDHKEKIAQRRRDANNLQF